MVSWYDAAAYCNWLSEQEGIPKEQWCYEPNKDGKYAEGMKMAPNYLKRTGYRLPTEAEWEYACRAGSEAGYSMGESEDLLGKYGWFQQNSLGKSHPVGSLKSNDLGLFDMHGNAWEWCQDAYKAYGKGEDGKSSEDIEIIRDNEDNKTWSVCCVAARSSVKRRTCVLPTVQRCAGEPCRRRRFPSGEDFTLDSFTALPLTRRRGSKLKMKDLIIYVHCIICVSIVTRSHEDNQELSLSRRRMT